MATPSIEASYQRRWIVLAVLCLTILCAVMANMALNVALPTLGKQLHASTSTLSWIVDLYALLFAGLLLPAGAIGDRFGRKGALQFGLILFIVSSVCGAYSTTSVQLLVTRSFMGIGAAFMMPGTLSILATIFPPEERGKAIGIWASVAGASVAGSIVWSGFMQEHFWWGSIFLGMALIAAVALVLGYFLLPTSCHPEESPMDPLGAILGIIGIGGLLYGFIQSPVVGWSSIAVLIPFAIGILGIIAFILWEQRVEKPMLDISFFRNRQFTLGSLSITSAYFALLGTYFVLTQYLQLVLGYSPLKASLVALPASLVQFVVANIARFLVKRYGFRLILGFGLLASTLGLLLVATCSASSNAWPLEIGLGLIGAGIGMTMPPATGAIMSSLPPNKAGVGSAINDLDREIGGAFGIGVLGSITVSHYQTLLSPSLTNQTAQAAATAKQGLAQGLSIAGGPNTALGIAARNSYSSGMDLALVVGAAIVFVAAISIWVFMPRNKPQRSN